MSIYCKIKKEFENFKLDIEFQGGNEVLSLLGASGSGKSMILRSIAGIEKPDSGKIVVDDIVFFDSEKNINLTPQERHTGLLFQDYALFPNMTVAQNISIAKSPSCKQSLEEILEKYHLTNQQDQYPSQLSGGQKQRCAIARMIVTCPNIILLDEPFSALDSFLKYKLEKELFNTMENYDKTIILVSHNRDEVYRLSHKTSIIINGSNMEMTEKHKLFANPQTCQGALLTGCKNIFPATYDKGFIHIDSLNIHYETITKELFEYVGIRANDFFYLNENQESDPSLITFPFQILEVTEGLYNYSLIIKPLKASTTLVMEVHKNLYPQIDQTKGLLAVKKDNIMFLNK